MKRVSVRINGSLPLMQHKPTLLDPLHRITKEYKAISKKRGKTEEDYVTLYELEFRAGIYYDEKLGVHVPQENLQACMRDAAKRTKNGANVERCIYFDQPRYAVIYKGPRTVDQLWEDANFRIIKPVRNSGGGSCMRCRPVFNEWALEFAFLLDESILDLDVCRAFWKDAGVYQGLMEERPNFGRFSLVSFTDQEVDGAE
ncbi:MAG: hypothetical protein H0U60_06455 [Blastocatellia bacterium]|nr:hypothetical protein [Blastocatellia bacterium]